MPTDKKEETLPLSGYKIEPEFRAEIIAFLEDRPYNESDFFLASMFEIEHKDPYFTEQAIRQLMEYISTCPRKVAKPMLAKFADENCVKKYTIKSKEGK